MQDELPIAKLPRLPRRTDDILYSLGDLVAPIWLQYLYPDDTYVLRRVPQERGYQLY